MNDLYEGDCREMGLVVPPDSVDLVVTSPPYDSLRTYGGATWNFDIFKVVASELVKVLKAGGVIAWVVGDSVVDGSETGTSFKQALYFKEIGLNLHDTMIYVKNSYPFPPKGRYYQQFEYMFVLSKGHPKTFNGLLQDTAWIRKGKPPTTREKDGSLVAMTGCTGKKTRLRDNVWSYNVGYMKTTTDKSAYEHPAIFPDKLAEDHILSWSNPGDTVLDPFAGSGTALVAAKKLGRNYVGIEQNPEYIGIIQKRLGV
jgi:site-specific DNA-methyltransferase (adenine-specific)